MVVQSDITVICDIEKPDEKGCNRPSDLIAQALIKEKSRLKSTALK